jgi:hypothetical protein
MDRCSYILSFELTILHTQLQMTQIRKKCTVQRGPLLVKGIVLGDSKRENISGKPPVTLNT